MSYRRKNTSNGVDVFKVIFLLISSCVYIIISIFKFIVSEKRRREREQERNQRAIEREKAFAAKDEERYRREQERILEIKKREEIRVQREKKREFQRKLKEAVENEKHIYDERILLRTKLRIQFIEMTKTN